MELHPGHRDLEGTRFGAQHHAGPNLQSLGLARGGVVPLDDALHPEDFLHRGGDQIAAEVHRHGQRLQGGYASEAVDNDSRHPVTLAPENTPHHGIDTESVAELLRPLEPSGEELCVEILTTAREAARDDL